MTLAFVVPWREAGRWIWDYLPPHFPHDACIVSAAPPHQVGSKMPPYLSEWYHLWGQRAVLRSRDVVFCWELRCALAAILVLGPWRRKTRVVAVGPILKGPMLRVLPLVRLLLAHADRIVCFSRQECDDYARLLRLPRDRFVFVPTPWLASEETSDADDGYICALGQSSRDYPTLLRAIEGTGLPLWIVAGTPAAVGKTPLPPHVKVSYRTGHNKTIDLIARATFHVIPLRDADYSAGQTVLLRAMARGKAVVVTDTPGVRDYVRDGETAILVPPGDVLALRAALVCLWSDAGERKRIGAQAAQSVRAEFGFARFARRMTEIAESF